MGIVSSFISQAYPPKPKFTDADIGDLSGKVYIVTGANTGVGKEVAQVLYSKNAKVYCAARSKDKADKAIYAIKNAFPTSTGELVFLPLDLADLGAIKGTADAFLARETRLHVLFNNAGVMTPPAGSRSAQGYELQLGVNDVGTFLLTRLLTPVLVATAAAEPASAAPRVVWVASSAAEAPQVPRGGVDFGRLERRNLDGAGPFANYCASKAGNYLHAAEFARRHRGDGVVAVPLNPGNLASDLWRERGRFVMWLLNTFVLYPSIYGAYTELFAAFSPEVTLEKSGEWVVPWGRFMTILPHLKAATKTEAEGGTGEAKKYWEWTEEQIKPYL